MQENHQATKYFIKFTQLSSCIYWGEAALLQQAYNGLAKQIKNKMVHHDKPTTLSGLWKLMQAIDTCYWEHKVEIAHEAPAANSSSNKSRLSKKNNNNKSSSDKGKGSFFTVQAEEQQHCYLSSGSLQNKGKSSESKKMSTRALHKLICRSPGYEPAGLVITKDPHLVPNGFKRWITCQTGEYHGSPVCPGGHLTFAPSMHMP